MQPANHLILHLTLEPETGSPTPNCAGADLAAYVRSLLDTLGTSAWAIGATPTELTLVVSLPHTMSTAHLVYCIKRSTERWLAINAPTNPPFRWRAAYSALTIDLRTLADAIRSVQARANAPHAHATVAA